MLAHPAKAGVIAAALGARPVARSIITSKAYQSAGIGPKIAKPGLVSRAARDIADAGAKKKAKPTHRKHSVGEMMPEDRRSTVSDAR
jgi:hypothetical protein